jgi:uncharacterized caspase-like protein
MTNFPEHLAATLEQQVAYLAEALAEASAAQQVVDAAEEHRGKIASRIAELSASREAIIGRRRTGAHDVDDGASLALIQADLEGLHSLLPDAAGRVEEASKAYRAASAACATHRAEIARLEAQAAMEATIKYADELATRLLSAIRTIRQGEIAAGLQGRPQWGAPPELYNELRTIASLRGEL